MPSCTRYLDKGFELVRQGGIGYSLTHAHCTQARLWLAQGETDKAQEALWQANQAAQASPLLHILLHNLACQTKLALLLGDVDGASRWVESDIGILGDLPPYLNEIRQISAPRVYLTKGNLKKSITTIDSVLDQAEAAGRTAHLIESYLLKALVFQAQKETVQAVVALKKAISFAAPDGFVRIFLEGGKSIWELLRLIVGQEPNSQYANQLLAVFDDKATVPKSLRATNPQRSIQDTLVESLSERECEVLKLIAAGYTNQQIADTLIVSLNTVKKHTTHIYGKLGVQNRMEASNYAREFGLV